MPEEKLRSASSIDADALDLRLDRTQPHVGGLTRMHEPDQRGSQRSDLEVKVDLESDHTFYTGLTQNLSTGGLFVATHDLRPVGRHLTLTFILPNSSKPVSVETEVRWIRENTSLLRHDGATGMGLQFVNLSPAAAAAIHEFLKDRDSLYFDDE